MSDGVTTRVSDGNTLRAREKRAPATPSTSKYGVATGSTMSGRSPSGATIITRVMSFSQMVAANAPLSRKAQKTFRGITIIAVL